jgi:hypothetical protein
MGHGPRARRPGQIHQGARITGHQLRALVCNPGHQLQAITNTRQTPGRAAHSQIKVHGPRPGAGLRAQAAQLSGFHGPRPRAAAHGSSRLTRARGFAISIKGPRGAAHGPGLYYPHGRPGPGGIMTRAPRTGQGWRLRYGAPGNRE